MHAIQLHVHQLSKPFDITGRSSSERKHFLVGNRNKSEHTALVTRFDEESTTAGIKGMYISDLHPEVSILAKI